MNIQENQIIGVNTGLSQFDSEIFGVPVYKREFFKSGELHSFLVTISKNAYVYAYVDKADLLVEEELKNNGFEYIGGHITYRLQKDFFITLIADHSGVKDHVTIAEQVYIKDAFSQVLASVSHYCVNKITADKAQEVYKRWIHNSFLGYADKYFIVEWEDKIVGFITMKLKNDAYHIDLLAVDSFMQGKGIGGTLINCAIEYAQQKNKQLYVTTQYDNQSANVLYQKKGFVLDSNRSIYFRVVT